MQIFFNFWSSKTWIRIRIGIQPKMLVPNPDPYPYHMNTDPKHCLFIRIRIRNTYMCIFSMVFWNWPKFSLAPLQLSLLAQRLQFLGGFLGALLQLPQDLGVDEVTALHSLLELQRLESIIFSFWLAQKKLKPFNDNCVEQFWAVLWIRTDFFRIHILLFSWFRILH